MDALEKIRRNTEDLINPEDLAARLALGRPLRVKLGVDPTRPDLTFGHMVVLNKLRQFQELGHEAILIIGDFTTLIGDPSGRSSTRPVLTRVEIEENAKTYLDQAFKVLQSDKTTVRYNSEWFRHMSFEEALSLTRKMTVARMLERDDFSQRYAKNNPISLIEFLYPLLQGYDSLMVEADVELGGTDQLFNLLVGRTLQREARQPEQIVITMPLLIGLDGVKKMSKSFNNSIIFDDSPKDMFGKIMSLNDSVMWDYYRLLLETLEEEIKAFQDDHPRDAKKRLALKLTSQFWGREKASHACEQFEQVFSQKKVPEQMPSFEWRALAQNETVRLIDLVGATGLFASKKEARRLIEQGAVKIDGERCEDPNRIVHEPENEAIIQAGKRTFFKVTHLPQG